ncbi:MAG: hypothetical protein ACU85U_22650, partial [Gammaproteobacteria bacterium]
APVAIVELAGVNAILSDDGHTIADDMLGGATAGVPVARAENARLPAHQHLDLSVPAPDTSPALRPEMLAKLLN